MFDTLLPSQCHLSLMSFPPVIPPGIVYIKYLRKIGFIFCVPSMCVYVSDVCSCVCIYVCVYQWEKKSELFPSFNSFLCYTEKLSRWGFCLLLCLVSAWVDCQHSMKERTMKVEKKVFEIIFLQGMRKCDSLYWIISFIVKVLWLVLTKRIVDDWQNVKILATCSYIWIYGHAHINSGKWQQYFFDLHRDV